jgi:hypothetical protein
VSTLSRRKFLFTSGNTANRTRRELSPGASPVQNFGSWQRVDRWVTPLLGPSTDEGCGSAPTGIQTMATISSLSSSAAIAAIAACVLSQAALADAVACPQTQHGVRLKTVTLFDGPPSEHADLAPDSFRETKGVGRSEWDVAYIFQAGRRLYVQCDYGPTTPAVTVEPAASTSRCVFLSKPDGNVSLTCGAR